MPRFLPALVLSVLAGFAVAQDTPAPEAVPDAVPAPESVMTMLRLAEIILAIDPDARPTGNMIELTIDDIPLVVVADPLANRMRAMVPIRSAEGLSNGELLRLMQANFDTALDARYAIARGRLWGVFIHPLSSLEKDQLLSALVQTVNVARTYGQSYSGGAQVFGGGDSNGIYQDLLKELQELGEEI